MRVGARLDENAFLRRQSISIALLCATVDLTVFSLVDIAGHPRTAVVFLVFAAILVVDLALALPPATAGWVALAHGVVCCGIGVVMVAPCRTATAWATRPGMSWPDTGPEPGCAADGPAAPWRC